MRRVLTLLAFAALTSIGGRPLLGGDSPGTYMLFDLGAYTPAGMNDAGQVAVNSNGFPRRAFVLSVAADGSVASTVQIEGVIPSTDRIVVSGISPAGTVVGTSPGATYVGSPPCDDNEIGYRDRATAADAIGARNLGRVVLFEAEAFCAPGVHDEYYEVSEARAMNASGVAVGVTRTQDLVSQSVATLYASGQATALHADVNELSEAVAINAAGKAVGWVRTNAGQRMKLWHQGAEHDIDIAGGVQSAPHDISDADVVVGSRSTSGPNAKAFMTKLSGTSVVSDTELPPLTGGTTSDAIAVNASGLVVGYSNTEPFGPQHAVAWVEGVARDLNDAIDAASPGLPTGGAAELTLVRALDVDSAGNILCRGTLADSQGTVTRTYLLRPQAAAAVITVSPPVVAFGPVVVGEKPKPKKFTVRNGTESTVTLGIGKLKPPFRLRGPASVKLAAGASREFTVDVAPRALGAQTGAVAITGGAQPISVPVSVEGIPEPAALTIAPGTVDFGKMFGTANRTIRIENLEAVPTRVRLSGLGKPFTFAPKAFTLAPHASIDVLVTASYPGNGTFEGTLAATQSVPHRTGASVVVKGEGKSVARIKSLVGEVAVRVGAGDYQPAAVGDELTTDDEIFTGVESTVVIEFPDGDIMELRELTQILIETIARKENRKDVAVRLRLGEINAKVKKDRVVDTNFEVQVPGITFPDGTSGVAASVRGTAFSASYDQASDTARFRVFESEVLVTPGSPALAPVLVPAGKQVRVTPTAVFGPEAFASAGGVRVLSVQGTVELVNSPGVPLTPGTDVPIGTNVITGDGSAADLVLVDGTVVSLRARTVARIGRIAGKARAPEVLVVLEYGAVLVQRVSKRAGPVDVRTARSAARTEDAPLFDVAFGETSGIATVRNVGNSGTVVVTPTREGSKPLKLPSRKVVDLTFAAESAVLGF